jgi:hypothetical protein
MRDIQSGEPSRPKVEMRTSIGKLPSDNFIFANQAARSASG